MLELKAVVVSNAVAKLNNITFARITKNHPIRIKLTVVSKLPEFEVFKTSKFFEFGPVKTPQTNLVDHPLTWSTLKKSAFRILQNFICQCGKTNSIGSVDSRVSKATPSFNIASLNKAFTSSSSSTSGLLLVFC